MDETDLTLFDPEERFRLLVESVKDYAIFMLDREGCFTSWSVGVERIKGWKSKEILGRHFSVLFTPEDIAAGKPQHELEMAARDGSFQEQGWRMRKDGSVFWADVTLTAIRNDHGNLIGFAKVTRDITEHEQAEQTLRLSEERLAFATQAAGLGTWNCDLVSGELVFSPLCADLFGIPPETPITHERYLKAIHPEDREHTSQAVRTAIERHEDYNVEPRVVRPDGGIHWVAIRGRCYYDSSGRPTRMSGVAFDITNHKRAEEALARSREELECLVQERTAELREAMGELELMSYSMVHDMRAPLRAMQGFSQMLCDEYAASLDSQAQDYCRRICESASRLDRLLVDALNYNRVLREELPILPVEIARLLRGMIASYPNLHPPAAEITVEFQELFVQANESLLTQCFGNLLGNAVKFVAPGTRPKVRVHAEPVEQRVRITVEDNGIGIPEQAQEQIFRMFQRMHHEREYPGTGMGLTIVKKAVERMGGRVGVQSKSGQGSKFWIELPIAAQPEMARLDKNERD